MKRKALLKSAFALAFLTGMAGVAHALSSSSQEMSAHQEKKSQATVSLYEQGLAASKNNDFKSALKLFKQALDQEPDNPDILNMLAHTQRKLGQIDESLENYRKALRVRPDFPEAREYLGEAYIQAALGEVETLRRYGDKGRESMEDLIQAIKEASLSLKKD
ncbi:MAG: tetratricopeptide repeat protein [Candidatus Omnitrophica bacterium]|nr:tetratricopeptide repeat protein [Candidatus Omnitrophota bacterium]